MNKRIFISVLVLSALGIHSHVYAGFCPDASNPLVISTNCYALTLLNDKSTVTVQNGVIITEQRSGLFSPVEVRAIIDNFTNNGTIQSVLLTPGAVEVSAFNVLSNGSIGSLINNGTITAAPSGKAGLEVNGAVNVLSNNGTISGTWGANALSVNGATINTLNNVGIITSVIQGIVLQSGGNITLLNNSGTIEGGINNTNSYSDAMLIESGASIGTLINTGTMNHSAMFTSPVDGHKEYFSAINNQGAIGIITNTGTFATNGGYGINNSGTISTLNNLQADLVVKGNLPNQYNIIVRSASNFGKLTATNINGMTNFGIYPGSVIPSEPTTYAAVLNGLTAGNLNAKTGTYGGGLVSVNWSLNNSSGTTWDLLTNTAIKTASPVVPNSSAASSLATQIVVTYNAAVATPASSSNSTLQNGTAFVAAVQSLTEPQLNQLTSVHAEGYSSNMTINLEQMKTVANTVMDRIHNGVSDRNSNALSYKLDEGRYVWADIAAFNGTVNSYNGLAGFGYNSYYGVVGVDLFRNQSGGLGIYGGAGNSQMTQSSQVSQSFNNNTGYVGMYGGLYLSRDIKLSGALGYSFGQSKASRNNPNVGDFTGGVASDSYSSNGAFAAVKLSQSMLLGKSFTLTPFVGGSYSQLNTSAVNESGGGDFNYSINAAKSYQTITFIGAEFVQPLKAGDNALSAIGFYRFSYNWSANTDAAHTVTANNSVFGTFNQTGANMGPVSNLFGLGLQGQLSKNTSLRIGAVAAVNSNGYQYGGGGELRVRF